MRRFFIGVLAAALLLLPATALAVIPADSVTSGGASTGIVQDYEAVRHAGLALAALAFLVGVVRLGHSEMAEERAKAQTLVIEALAAFVVLLGDRFFIQGVARWFGQSPVGLPPFWQ